MFTLWQERCRQVVALELGNRGWALVRAEDDFLAEVVGELGARYSHTAAVTDPDIARATVRCYTRVLFDACGRDGTAEQRRAFDELWDYMYSHAVYRLHEQTAAQDALQETLGKVFEKRATCKDAGCFLGWCDQILRNVIAGRFRSEYQRVLTARGVEFERREISQAEWDGGNVTGQEDQTGDSVPDTMQDTLKDALGGPMRDALLTALRDCLENERQVTVVLELFINDKNFLEVAELLRTSPLNAQVIKSRALQKLRDCPEMIQLYEDWLA